MVEAEIKLRCVRLFTLIITVVNDGPKMLAPYTPKPFSFTLMPTAGWLQLSFIPLAQKFPSQTLSNV